LDLNALLFDGGANFLEAAYFADPVKMNGLVSLSEDIKGGSSSGNNEALTVDWGGLSGTSVEFVAIVLHAFSGQSLSEASGCHLSCEWKGQVFFEHDCSDAAGTGFFWGFAFKDDQGQWWFIEMDMNVSG